MNEEKHTKPTDKQLKAYEFAASLRGQFILSQALVLAIKSLEQAEGVHKEVSNISDMQFLLDHMFPMYKGVANYAS